MWYIDRYIISNIVNIGTNIATNFVAILFISATKFEVYCWFRCHPWHYRMKYANVATGSQYGEKFVALMLNGWTIGETVWFVVETKIEAKRWKTYIFNHRNPLWLKLGGEGHHWSFRSLSFDLPHFFTIRYVVQTLQSLNFSVPNLKIFYN